MNAFNVCARGPRRPPVLNTNAWSSRTGISRYLARWRTCDVRRGAIKTCRGRPSDSAEPGSSTISLAPRSRNVSGLLRIGFSRHHDHGITGLSNRLVERGNAVGDEDVACELQIDQRRVAGAQGVVGFVEQDLVWQTGRSAQLIEQQEHRADVLAAAMVWHSRQIDDHADAGVPKGASKIARVRRGVLATERHDAG